MQMRMEHDVLRRLWSFLLESHDVTMRTGETELLDASHTRCFNLFLSNVHQAHPSTVHRSGFFTVLFSQVHVCYFDGITMEQSKFWTSDSGRD